MARAKKKLVTMVVTVSVPAWLGAAAARKEVRTLIGQQCFHGHRNGQTWEEIDESNLKVKSVQPPSIVAISERRR